MDQTEEEDNDEPRRPRGVQSRSVKAHNDHRQGDERFGRPFRYLKKAGRGERQTCRVSSRERCGLK